MRTKHWAAAVLLLVSVSACSSSKDADDAGDADGSIGDVTAPTARTPLAAEAGLPFAWYYDAAPRWRANEDRARSQLVNDCMVQQGFTFGTGAAPSAPELRSYLESWFGVGDAAVVAAYGYLEPNRYSAPEDVPADPAELEAYNQALWGSLSGDQEAVVDPVSGQQSASSQLGTGCLAEASDQLYGSSEARNEFNGLDIWIQGQTETAIEATKADPDVVDAVEEWSDCMDDAGYDYPTPLEPMIQDWPEPRPGRDEIETAVADVGCKVSTGYFDVVIEAQAANEADAVERHPDIVEQVRQARESVDGRATAILSGHDPD